VTLPEDLKQLKEYTRPRQDGAAAGVISFWELRGRELILYCVVLPREKERLSSTWT